MTPQFITLPTGTRINTAHLIHYQQSEHEGQIHLVLTDEPTPWLETMTLEQMDQLLQPQSPLIQDSVVNLDRLKLNAGVQFTYDGKQLHGVIAAIDPDERINVISDGVRYYTYPTMGEFNRLS